jgi:hypothetical protein
MIAEPVLEARARLDRLYDAGRASRNGCIHLRVSNELSMRLGVFVFGW